MDYVVNTDFLNIRNKPKVGKNIITALPKGQKLHLLTKSPNHSWWEVSTSLDGLVLKGFVASKYLIEAAAFTPERPVKGIQAVHRKEHMPHVNRQSRASGWSYPLAEAGKPMRDNTNPKTMTESLGVIIHWLDVEYSPRYQPTSQSTYCYIYAHDYCYLSGTYLPRVWWSSRALLELAEGKEVAVDYGISIYEMNANNLYTWLMDFGSQFGWQRTYDVTALQNYANQGKVCLIAAKNKKSTLSGHICAVVPENEQNWAFRNGSGLSPLVSQAGRRNFQYKTNYNWWYGNSFSHFGFWYHD